MLAKDEITQECVVPESKFDKNGCFYSFRGIKDGKRYCGSECCQELIKQVNTLKAENEKLQEQLAEVRSEI